MSAFLKKLRLSLISMLGTIFTKKLLKTFATSTSLSTLIHRKEPFALTLFSQETEDLLQPRSSYYH